MTFQTQYRTGKRLADSPIGPVAGEEDEAAVGGIGKVPDQVIGRPWLQPFGFGGLSWLQGIKRHSLRVFAHEDATAGRGRIDWLVRLEVGPAALLPENVLDPGFV